MRAIITCSISQELRNLMKEKHISPSKALKVGALQMLGEPFKPEKGVTIAPSEINKVAQVQQSMQKAINDMEEEKEQYKNKYDALLEEKRRKEQPQNN